jgi:hypothetical protein
LSGYPPPDVADELRDLLEQVQFDRHLDVRGITLEAGEFQFSIAGKAVAHGMTLSTIFVERIVNIEKIIFRTVERTLGKEFREQGQPSHSLQEGYSLYMATPRPGSFSVTLRLGRQMQLPELDLSPQIVTDVIECFNLLNNDDEQLRERIPQEVYYRNFVQLAKNIAPDGEQVSLVGLTAGKGTDEIRARFTRTKKEIQVPPPPPILNEPDSKNGKFVEVQGRLLFADAEKDERVIRLRSKTGKSYQIIVPPGMMNDIVRPLWDDIVVVRGQQYGKKIYLSDIDRTSDEA